MNMHNQLQNTCVESPRRRPRGYTLIEVLIALAVFAILATITSTSIYNAFTIRTVVNQKMDRLNNLQLMMSIVEQDLSQIVPRSVRGQQMRLYPSIIGQHYYLEYTRDGITNPKSLEKRSTLKRVALLCKDHKFIRRTYPMLDTKDRDNYQDSALLSNLNGCYFSYLNEHLDLLPQWREQPITPNQPQIKHPNAIQIHLEFENKNKMNLLFPIF